MKPTTGKIEDEYAWATECQLATLSGLIMGRRPSLTEVTRQRNISFHMLKVCQEHASEITWGDDWRRHYGRVQQVLDDAKVDNASEAINRYTKAGLNMFGDNATRWFKSFEKSEAERCKR